LKLAPEAVDTDYAWSLAVVEMLQADGGDDINRLLERMAVDSSAEAAIAAALHRKYSDLNAATAAYLRRTYLQGP
jgi:hypothetical protein